MSRRKGFHLTQEHKDRIAATKRGALNPNWKGDSAKPQSGRARAARIYKDIGSCVNCGNPKSQRHHIDRNTLNNNPDNIKILCGYCHLLEDGRLEALVAFNHSRKKIRLPKRGTAGECNPHAKIRASDIPVIFYLYASGMLQREIGDIFGIKQTQVSKILLKQSWKRPLVRTLQ